MIMEALGKKSVSQMKAHYKAIQPKTDEEKKEWADKYASSGKGQVDGPAKQATGKREEGGGWNDQVKKPDWNSCGNDGDGGAAGTGGKKRGQSNVSPTSSSRDSSYNIRPPKQTTTNINTNASNKASTDDKVRKNLKDFVAKYEKDMWLAAASRHYDTTGQRISAEMAKAMIEGGRGKGTGKG